MRINHFKLLSEFRGLSPNYSISFESHSNDERIEPICFVGLNGSGKSNVLEAIAEAFFYLEAYSEERSLYQLRKYKTDFGFNLEFEINPTWQDLNISWDKLGGFTWSGVGNIRVQYIKEQGVLPIMILHGADSPSIVNDRDNFILPNRIVGYSSGMNELISNPFHKIDFFYVEKLREQSQGIDTYRPQLNRMFLLDYEANKIATICSQLYREDNNIALLNDELKVRGLHSFSIYLRTNRPNFVNFTFPSSITLIIEKLIECASANNAQDDVRKRKLNFAVTDELKGKFRERWATAYDLFRDLYQLRLMNTFLIPDALIKQARDLETGKNLSAWLPKATPINQIFFIDEICFAGNSDEIIFYKHLSDGEHQLLHSLSGLMLLEAKNSIFILDEPDTHFNPDWRSRYVSLLNDVLNDRIKEQQIFITSHSPFVISDCKPENVFFFKKGEDAKTAKEIEFNTYGASIDNILKNFFGSKNLISKYSLDELKKVIDEGTVEELRNAIDIFGESSEKQFLFKKLYEKTHTGDAD